MFINLKDFNEVYDRLNKVYEALQQAGDQIVDGYNIAYDDDCVVVIQTPNKKFLINGSFIEKAYVQKERHENGTWVIDGMVYDKNLNELGNYVKRLDGEEGYVDKEGNWRKMNGDLWVSVEQMFGYTE